MLKEESRTKRQIPWTFFAITFAWAWGFWMIPLATTREWIVDPKLSGLRMPLLVVGAFAPFVAAFILSLRDGTAGALFRRSLRLTIPLPVLLTALLLSPVLAGCAVWMRSMQDGIPFAIQIGWRAAAMLLPLLFFLGGSCNEEFGWAYAIDRMQPRWGSLRGSLLLGSVWACWHLPLFFMPTQSQAHMPFVTFLMTCCSLRLLFVWAYNRAQGSILVTLLFHTSMNFTLNLFMLLDPKVSTLHQVTWMYYTGLLALSALGVALVTKSVGFEAVRSRSADQ